jgi:uncharacterized protein (TIGR03067 family)
MKYVAGLVIVAIASVAWCADSKTKDDSGVNGVWALTSGVKGGEAMPAEALKAVHLLLRDGKYHAKIGNVVDTGTYTVDTSKSPKTLTLTGTNGPNKGKTMLAIFEVEGTTLKVCYDLSGKAFPASFESKPKTDSFLATYERSKVKKQPFKTHD